MGGEQYEVAIAGFFSGKWMDVGEPLTLTPREAKYLKIDGKIRPVAKAKAKPTRSSSAASESKD